VAKNVVTFLFLALCVFFALLGAENFEEFVGFAAVNLALDGGVDDPGEIQTAEDIREVVDRIRKLSKITIVQSSKSLKISRTIVCNIPLAGPTPSGRKTGLTSAQGVCTLRSWLPTFV
jgi:hypothetical protein